MAVSARELLLIVRAQNQASGALRRVGRDLGGLGNKAALRNRLDQLRVNEQQFRATKQRAAQEIQSYKTGTKALALRKRALAVEKEMTKAVQAQKIAAQGLTANRGQIRANNRAIKDLQAKALLPGGGAGFAARDLRLAQTKAIELRQEQKLLKRAVTEASVSMDRAQLTANQYAAAEKEAAYRTAQLNAQIQTQNDRLALNARKMKETEAQIARSRFIGKVTSAGKLAQHFGTIALYGGATLAATLGFAAHAAANFETQGTLAATQVANKLQDTHKAAIQINKDILQLMASGKGFADSTQQQKSAYDIFSSMTLSKNQGTAIKQGMAILKQFNKAAVAGQADLTDVTHAGITILNDFADRGQQVRELPSLLNRMFASVRYGRTTITEFVSSLNQIAPAFSSAFGKSPETFNQLAGAMAALTRHMPSSRMAATSLARLVGMFNDPNFIAGMAKADAPITTATGHLKSFSDILEIVTKRFPALKQGGPNLENFFKIITGFGSGKAGNKGTIQGRRAFSLLIQNMENYRTVSRQVVNDNNEFSKSFLALSKTPGVQWKVFMQQIHAFAIEIGTAVIPMITRLGRPLMQVVDWFNKLSDKSKSQIGKWAAMAAVGLLLGAAILYVTGTITRLWGLLARGVGGWNALIILIIAAATAIQVLNHGLHGMSDIMDAITTQITGHGWAGWAVGLGLAAVASYKLAGGLRNIYGTVKALAEIRALVGIGGGTKMLLGGKVIGAEAGAGVAAAAGTAATLGITLGLVTAVAGGVLLWKHHMDDVKKVTEETNDALKHNKDYYNKASKFAKQGLSLATDAGAVSFAQADLHSARAAAKAAAKLAAAHPTQSNKDALTLANIAVGQAQDRLYQANARSNKSFLAVGKSLAQVTQSTKTYAAQVKLLHDRRKELNKLETTFDPNELRTGTVNPRIADLKKRIELQMKLLGIARQERAQSKITFAKIFDSQLQQLARYGLITGKPQKLTQNQIGITRDVAEHMGRMLSQNELKMLVQAEIDPKSAAKLPRQLKALLGGAESRAFTQKALAPLVAIGKTLFGEPKNAKNAKSDAAKAVAARALYFMKHPAKMPVKIVPPNPAQLQGIAKSIEHQIPAIHIKVAAHVQTTVATGVDTGSNSRFASFTPSQDMIKTGVKIATTVSGGSTEGLAAGTAGADALMKAVSKAIRGDAKQLLDAVRSVWDGINQANTSAMGDIFAGPQGALTQLQKFKEDMIQTKIDWGIPLSTKDLMYQQNQQIASFKKWRNSIHRLTKQGVPTKMIEQIVAQGPSAEPFLAALGRMTPKERKAYVARWRAGQRAIETANKADMNRQLVLWKTFGKNIATAILDGLKSEDSAITTYLETMVLKLIKSDPNVKTRHPAHVHKSHKTSTGGGALPPGLTANTRPAAQKHTTYVMNDQGSHSSTMQRKAAFRNKHLDV